MAEQVVTPDRARIHVKIVASKLELGAARACVEKWRAWVLQIFAENEIRVKDHIVMDSVSALDDTLITCTTKIYGEFRNVSAAKMAHEKLLEKASDKISVDDLELVASAKALREARSATAVAALADARIKADLLVKSIAGSYGVGGGDGDGGVGAKLSAATTSGRPRLGDLINLSEQGADSAFITLAAAEPIAGQRVVNTIAATFTLLES